MTQIEPEAIPLTAAAETADATQTVTETATTPAAAAENTQTVQIVTETNATEIHTIEDEAVPLAVREDEADTLRASDTVTIEDEATPLTQRNHCKVHAWEALLTGLYTIYQLVRAKARDRKISKLEDEKGETKTSQELGEEK